MCRIDDAEPMQIFHEAKRKARKPHKCTECHREIPKGETYLYEFGKCEGTPETFRTCSHCMIAREWLRENCGGWIYTQVIEEIGEHADEYPELREPLAALVAGARAKWQGAGLPKMPPPIPA